MAFENIGIGGILTFDSRGAVANMGLAQRAFGALSQSAVKVQASVSKIATGVGGLFGGLGLVGGAAIAGVGFGIKKWVSEGISFNKEMETSELAIATILSTVKKTPLSQEMEVAKQAMIDLNRVAAEAPGELSDITNIFQLMTGPMTVGKANMEDIFKATKGTAILAGVLKRSFNDTGQAMSKLTAGQVELGNDIHMMLKSMGLLTETTQEWKALLPEQRVKRIMQMLQTFEESGERVGKTWEATSSTTSSIIKQLAGSFTRKMFDNMTAGLTDFNDQFFKNQKEWMSKAGKFGEMFGNAIRFVTNEVKELGRDIIGMIGKVKTRFDQLGLSVDTGALKHIAAIVVKVGAIAVAISPVVTIVGFLGSKLMAVFSIVQGLGGLIAAVGAPLLPVIAAAGALFLLFRRDGEPVMQTLVRAFEYIKRIGAQAWEGMKPGVQALVFAFRMMRDTLVNMWERIQPGLASLRQVLAGLMQLAIKVFTHMFNMFAKIAMVGAAIWRAIEPGVSAIFNAVMRFVKVVVDALNFLFPKIMSIMEPIINTVLEIGYAVGRVIGKLLEFLAPLIDGMTWLWQNVLVPFAGFVLDVLGPVVTTTFRVIGAAIEIVLGIVGKVIDGMKWLAEKAGAIISTVGEAITTVFGSNDMIAAAMAAMQKDMKDTNQVVNDVVRNLQIQMMMAKLAAMGAQEIVMMVAMGLRELYEDTLRPIVDTGLQVLNAFKGEAEIKTKQPDVKVDVNVNNKSTMCVNGRNLAVAQGQYETEVAERSGFNRTPWQTQRVQITGVKP